MTPVMVAPAAFHRLSCCPDKKAGPVCPIYSVDYFNGA